MHYNVWVVRAAFDGCKYLRVHPACMYYNVCFIRAVLAGVVYIHRLLSGMVIHFSRAIMMMMGHFQPTGSDVF